MWQQASSSSLLTTPPSLRIVPTGIVLVLLQILIHSSNTAWGDAFVVTTPVWSMTPRSLSNLAMTDSSLDSSSSSSSNTLPIIINGQNIALTDALVDHVNKRIGNTLSKLMKSGAVRECDVILSVSKNPKVKNGHRVEIVTNLKGTTIICKNSSPDMYASVDAASHALSRKLRTYKERRTEGWHGGARMGDELAAALEMDETTDEVMANSMDDLSNGGGISNRGNDFFFEDSNGVTASPTVTKVKSFQLDKAVSLEEAVFALDYVDHDFYVFRNEATDQINVVYKRHTGGIGLVEP